MTFLAHIADRVLNTPLLILPSKAEVILSVLAGRVGVNSPEASRFEGDQPPQKDENGNVKRDIWGDAKLEPFRVSGGVGIITITGSLVNRGAWVGANSGLTSYEGIQHQLKRAAASPEVHAILLDLHTPGGEAVGAFETAALVREIGRSKPVTALVNGMAASAGYAIGSGAGRIITTETGVSGSIGVVLLHADYSRQLANEGVTPTLIFAGAHKVDGHPFGPLPDSVKADLQAEVDSFYTAFLNTVATGRGSRLSADGARLTEARTFIGEAAVKSGLADDVGSFESVLQDLTRAHSSGSGTSQPQGGRTSQVKGKPMSENTGAPAAASNAGLTQADLDAAVAKAVADTTAKLSADADEKVKADRARIAGLDALLAKAGNSDKAQTIVTAAKESGATVEATALELINADAFKQAAVLDALAADDKTAAGAKPAAQGGAVPQTEAGWKAEWEGSEALKAEFDTAGSYVAFKKREAKQKGA